MAQQVLDRRLVGWKAIAGHLARDERTAKRWESTRGMPVRRVPGGQNASVFAFADELDEWLRTTPARAIEDAPPAADQEPAPETRPVPDSPAPPRLSPRLRWLMPAAGIAVAAIVAVAAPWSRSGAAAERPANPAAADAYFAALHALGGRTPAGIALAEHDFRAVLAREPRFAPAHVGLADCYGLAREFGTLPDIAAYPRAEREARAALAIDPQSGGAHRVLGFVDFWFHHDAPAAEAEFRRAIELTPGDARVHHWFANVLSTLGRTDEAMAEIDRARGIDPEATAILADRALIRSPRDLAGARAELLRLSALDPRTPGPPEWGARLALAAHDGPEFVRLTRLSARLRGDADEAADADVAERGLGEGGWPGLMRALLAETERRYLAGQIGDYRLANLLAVGGDPRAAGVLARSLAAHDPEAVGLLGNPVFARVRAAHPELTEAARTALGISPRES